MFLFEVDHARAKELGRLGTRDDRHGRVRLRGGHTAPELQAGQEAGRTRRSEAQRGSASNLPLSDREWPGSQNH